MAAGGYKEFVAGETLDQDEINDYLMQGMLVFAGTAARGSAIGTPVEGQFTYLADSDKVEFYDSTQWVELSTSPGAAVVSGTTGSPTVGTVSSGGTTYNVYSFTGDGSITFSEAGFAELLVVGGGGSGGQDSFSSPKSAGGGGGGGMLEVAQAYFAVGTATVIVGAGGAASTGNARALGNTGESSKIGDFVAPGGGGGGGTNTTVFVYGTNGGSGGGAPGGETAGDGLTGLGFDGGDGVLSPEEGGGGGGASEAGNTDGQGEGGDGKASTITGTSVTYAGGGGAYGSVGSNNGGDGGGGATGVSGTANTGGGGGAQRGTPGSGGSGIVIVRVAV